MQLSQKRATWGSSSQLNSKALWVISSAPQVFRDAFDEISDLFSPFGINHSTKATYNCQSEVALMSRKDSGDTISGQPQSKGFP